MPVKDGQKVITGTIIKITATPKGGKPITIGRATSLSVQESYGVRPIYGIGSMTPQELPILQWQGQMQLGLFAIPSKDALLSQFTKQGTVTQVINNLLFNEGVDVVVARRIKPTSNVNEDYLDVCSINGCISQSESLEISEGNVVMRSGSFVFAQPVTFL